jgi:ATP-dependent Lon protease
MLRRPKRPTDRLEIISNKKQKYTKEDSMVNDQENAISSDVAPVINNDISIVTQNKEEDILNDKANISNDEDDEDEDYEEEEDEEDIINDEIEQLTTDTTDIKNNYLIVKNELKKSEPNVSDLFSIPLRLEDRAKLTQYYNIYKGHIPFTDEWLESRNRYNYLLKEYKQGYKQYTQFSESEHQKMKDEEEKLTSFDAQLALKYKILSLTTSPENKCIIYRRYEELLSLDTTNDEYGKLKHWLKWATEIPHDIINNHKVDNITTFIKNASEKLNKELYGMEKIKEQILLFLSAKIMNPNMKRSNLGLVGPPGVGKTAIARMIANLLDSGFEQISFGGVDKADFLKGHEYTYVGAQPGEIVKCLKRMGHKNGIIFLDELDKAAEHPDISAALLHLVDQSQNYDFRDNFLGEISIDLSHVWYIGSMNLRPSDEALADRWWIIDVGGYTIKDKSKIVKEYLLPKALTNINMDKSSVYFNDKSVVYFINKVSSTSDKGVRTIQKAILDLINKIHFIITHQNEEGKLPFLTSFNLNTKINLPLLLEKSIIDKLTENKQLSDVLNMMYI